MTQVKGVGRKRTQLLDDLRNRIRYWEIKEEAENDSLSIEHKEEIHIFRKSKDLLISSIHNNNSNNNNSSLCPTTDTNYHIIIFPEWAYDQGK